MRITHSQRTYRTQFSTDPNSGAFFIDQNESGALEPGEKYLGSYDRDTQSTVPTTLRQLQEIAGKDNKFSMYDEEMLFNVDNDAGQAREVLELSDLRQEVNLGPLKVFKSRRQVSKDVELTDGGPILSETYKVERGITLR
jgi:hypothetical protein